MRKGGLLDFQKALSARLAAAASRAATHSLLAVESGGTNWLIELPEVSEVLVVPKLTRVSMARPYYAGVANVRGNLYSVIDLSVFCGRDPTSFSNSRRLLLCGKQLGLNAGVLVARVSGLRRVEDLVAGTAQAGSFPWSGAARADREGVQYLELRMGALVRHPEFMNIAAA